MADLIQHDPAPAPSKTEFDALSEQVSSLNSNIGQKVSYSYDTAGSPVSANTLNEGMFFGVLTQATSPDGTANYWFVITMPRATGIQIVFAIGGAKMYVRPRTSNTWGAWKTYTGS